MCHGGVWGYVYTAYTFCVAFECKLDKVALLKRLDRGLLYSWTIPDRDRCFTPWRATTYSIHPLLHLSTLIRNIFNLCCQLAVNLL